MSSLTNWFKSKLSDDQIKTIYQSVSGFTPAAWNGVVKTIIENGKPSPGYFPTVKTIREEHDTYVKNNPYAAAPIQYDTEDDDRFPIDLMWRGFEILERTKDERQFRKFAASVRMPLKDIDRVIAKYKKAYGVKIDFNEDGRFKIKLSEGGAGGA
jgi:hypothetical protein